MAHGARVARRFLSTTLTHRSGGALVLSELATNARVDRNASTASLEALRAA